MFTMGGTAGVYGEYSIFVSDIDILNAVRQLYIQFILYLPSIFQNAIAMHANDRIIHFPSTILQ